MKRDEIYFEAMRTRDNRYDGKFFVGVKTTGVYCRPICPAKPKRQNVEFFSNRLEAERSGYRPCLRCRPESAPQSPAWIGKTAVVQRAVKLLSDLVETNEEKFAMRFGVSARHLRRLFIEEIGKAPKQIAIENRLNLARKLIVETNLPIGEVGLAAGFQSIRRFNDAFKIRFERSPRLIRRSPLSKSKGLMVSIPYRPPFDFAGLIGFYSSHRVGNLEWFEHNKMFRVVEFGSEVGLISISDDPQNSRVLIEIDFPSSTKIHSIVSRVRSLMDLDSDPLVIANSLESDRDIKRLLSKYPGVRLPSGWDPFEVAISTILGQLVSVERGRSLVADLIELLGREVMVNDRRVKLFPTPEKIATSDLTGLKTTTARKRALIAFSRGVANKEILLEPTQDVDRFLNQILLIPGIGPWTANYMALKVLRHTDAFPETDLILARALEIHPKENLVEMSPWRGYVAALLWREYSISLKKGASREAI